MDYNSLGLRQSDIIRHKQFYRKLMNPPHSRKQNITVKFMHMYLLWEHSLYSNKLDFCLFYQHL